MKLKTGSQNDLVEIVQKRLTDLGYSPGAIDGVFGPETKRAVVAFQTASGLTADGTVEAATAALLKIDGILRVSDLERRQYRTLVSRNPNYFGNFPATAFKAVKKMHHNTAYEEITCVGFNPQRDTLHATVQLKKDYGYCGDLCDDGSLEYVRFFIDYGDGWENLGVVAFTAHDLPGETDCSGAADKPLSYGLTLPIDPRREDCAHPVHVDLPGHRPFQGPRHRGHPRRRTALRGGAAGPA